MDEGAAVEGEAPMKPNPMTLTHLDNALAILRGYIEPQDEAIKKYLADVEARKPDLFKEEENGTNQND